MELDEDDTSLDEEVFFFEYFRLDNEIALDDESSDVEDNLPTENIPPTKFSYSFELIGSSLAKLRDAQ